MTTNKPDPEAATRALQTAIARAMTLATRSGLSHADCALISLGIVTDELSKRLGKDWVRTLVGVIDDKTLRKLR